MKRALLYADRETVNVFVADDPEVLIDKFWEDALEATFEKYVNNEIAFKNIVKNFCDLKAKTDYEIKTVENTGELDLKEIKDADKIYIRNNSGSELKINGVEVKGGFLKIDKNLPDVKKNENFSQKQNVRAKVAVK